VTKKKKQPMGEAASGMVSGAEKRKASLTGAQVVAAVAGTPTPKADLLVTTVRLRRDQWDALRQEATRRALEAPGGRDAPRKPDVSALLRDLVDRWMDERR
jgi:hypothetical protein